MGRRFGAAWVLALTFAGAVAVVRAETDAQCARCGKWVKLSDQGRGFARKWEGLCGKCVDPKARCGDAIKDLERRIAELREAAKYWQWVLDNPGGGGGSKGGTLELLGEMVAVQQARIRLAETEKALESALRRLEAMKKECAARGAGDDSGGVADTVDDIVRGGARGVASHLWNQVEATYQGAKLLADGASGVARKATAAPTAAEQLDAIEGYMKSLVQPAEAAPSGAVASEATAESAPAESQEDLIRPTLADLRKDLPADRVAKDLALSERHARNAVAYADALRKSVDQFEAAKAKGDPARAKKHRDHATYLAAMGQKELRQSVADRTAAIQALYQDTMSFERGSKGITVEEALAAWQEEVRSGGLPADYMEKLRKAGLSDGDIAKRKEWLLGVDPRAAAVTRANFVALVAPRYLPAARGKANAAQPLPEADDLWDLATIMLLDAAPAEEATEEAKPDDEKAEEQKAEEQKPEDEKPDDRGR